MIGWLHQARPTQETTSSFYICHVILTLLIETISPMNSFFKINCYPTISILSPIFLQSSLFCLGFRVDMVSCMRPDFFIFYLLSSLILLSYQLFAYIVMYLMLWKPAELKGWDCSHPAQTPRVDPARDWMAGLNSSTRGS